MTKQQIIKTIKKANNNPSIKWSITVNTPERIVIVNDYDKGINYSIEVMREDVFEWIRVTDNLRGLVVSVLLNDTKWYGDYDDTEQGLLLGVKNAVYNFNRFY